MQVPARQQLIIFVDGEETPGLIVYGLGAPGTVLREPPHGRCALGPVAQTYLLHGEGWEVALWEIPISSWPSGAAWREKLTATLESAVAGGAKVAWIDAEGNPFADPPYLFDPSYMAGSVLTWMTADGRRGGVLDPDLPLSSASDTDLRELRRYAVGLADAG